MSKIHVNYNIHIVFNFEFLFQMMFIFEKRQQQNQRKTTFECMLELRKIHERRKKLKLMFRVHFYIFTANNMRLSI